MSSTNLKQLPLENNSSRSYALSPEQIKQYHEDGFVIVRNFFQPEEIEPLVRSLSTHTDEYTSGEISAIDNSGKTYSVIYWTELGNSLLGVFPRVARVIEGAEALLGEPCYHWHSKVCRKLPHSGRVEWHQDYGSWYYDGCIAPQLISCAIAIESCSPENGALQMLKGTHKLGRIDIIKMGNTVGADPQRLEVAINNAELVDCTMEPGDAVFFHSNVLHGSPPNNSDRSRGMMFCSYNAVSNEPFIEEGQEHHHYKPLEKLPDSIILDGNYGSTMDNRAEVYKPNPEIDGPYMNILPFEKK